VNAAPGIETATHPPVGDAVESVSAGAGTKAELQQSRRQRAASDGPFAWQDKRVLRQIRERIEDYGTALAVYAALSIVASDNQTERFPTTHQWLSQLSGFSVATVKRRLEDLQRIGAVHIVTPKFKAPAKYTLLAFVHGEPTPLAHGAIAHENEKSGSNHELHQKKQESRMKTETETGVFADSNALASKGIPFNVEEVYEFAGRNQIDENVTSRYLRYNNIRGWQVENWRGALLKFRDCCMDSPEGEADAVPEGWVPEIITPEYLLDT